MKNKREIILDFTSLLDVMMLLMFFFVIFAQFDTNEANEAIAQAESAQVEAEQKISEASNELAAANEAKERADAEREKLQENNALAEAVILSGASDFNSAVQLKLYLSENDDEWKISVKSSTDDEIGEISDVRNRDAPDIAKDFDVIIKEHGYTEEDAVLCDLIYNSGKAGSYKAKNNTDDMLDSMKKELSYEYLFYSATDLSDFEEE